MAGAGVETVTQPLKSTEGQQAAGDDEALGRLMAAGRRPVPEPLEGTDLDEGCHKDDSTLALLMGNARPRPGEGRDDAALIGLLAKKEAAAKANERPGKDDATLTALLAGGEAARVLVAEEQGPGKDDATLTALLGRPVRKSGSELADDERLSGLMAEPEEAARDDAALEEQLRRGPKDVGVPGDKAAEVLQRIAALKGESKQRMLDAETILALPLIEEASAEGLLPSTRPQSVRPLLAIRLSTEEPKPGSLCYFAAIGDAASARHLCEQARRCGDTLLVSSRDDRERTALHYAAYTGDADMADLLLQAGADPLLRDTDGRQPMHMAASRGAQRVARLLVGAALFHLRARSLRHFREARSSREDVRAAERRAAQAVLAEYLRSLEELRYQLVLSEDRLGFLPLHYALRDGSHGCLPVLQLLLRSLYEFGSRADEVMRLPRFQAQPGLSLVELLSGHLFEHQREAARREHTKRSAEILDEILNGPDAHGTALLHYAAAAGNYRAVQLLLDCGADPGRKTVIEEAGAVRQSLTALDLAVDGPTREALLSRGEGAFAGQASTAMSLVDAGCEHVNKERGIMGRTSLHTALLGIIGHAGPPTPLLTAVFQAHPESDPLATDANGWTPIHYACAYGREQELRQLLAQARRLEPHACTLRPTTAQQSAQPSCRRAETGRMPVPGKRGERPARARSAGVVKRMEVSTTGCGSLRGRTPTHLAAQGTGEEGLDTEEGRVRCLACLEESGLLDLEGTDDEGFTPFLAACAAGALPAVRWLLERSADCYKVDRLQRNALHLSMAKGHRRLVRLLCIHDADTSRLKSGLDWKGRRPSELAWTGPARRFPEDLITVWEAARRGDADQLGCALRAGAAVDAVSPGGWTAAMCAASAGHLPLLRQLIALRCSCEAPAEGCRRPHVRPALGRGPLHLAAQAGHADACLVLLQLGGASLQAKSQVEGGHTPLLLALASGHLSVLKVLVEQGADPCAGSPLELLASKGTDGHVSCAQWLLRHLDQTNPNALLSLLQKWEDAKPARRVQGGRGAGGVQAMLAQALRRAMQRTEAVP